MCVESSILIGDPIHLSRMKNSLCSNIIFRMKSLVMTHPSHNPFRPSGILPSIIRPVPSQPESQVKPQNDSPFMKKDKEPVYQLPDPTPIAQVHLLLDTCSRPIPVIALFDTGAAATILHPRI